MRVENLLPAAQKSSVKFRSNATLRVCRRRACLEKQENGDTSAAVLPG
jgi:hypothetical protein